MGHVIPPYGVYHGALTAVSGTEGDCASALFSARGHASWDPTAIIDVANVKAANLLSCDIANKLPLVGDLCDIRYKPDGSKHLFLLTHSLIFKDCEPDP